MKYDRFLACLTSDRDLFSLPYSWTDFDPFEDLLSKIESKQGNIFNITDDLYAQCWNRGYECDGMWRNYTSPFLDDGVMISSCPRTILNSIYGELDIGGVFSDVSVYTNAFDIERQTEAMLCAFPVEYLSVEKIVQEYESYFNNLDDNEAIKSIPPHDPLSLKFDLPATLFSKKRRHYSYEREVRFFLQFIDNKPNSFELLPDKGVLVPGFRGRVERIVFSPKTPSCVFDCRRQYLEKEFKFNHGQIKKSDLYDIGHILKNTSLRLR